MSSLAHSFLYLYIFIESLLLIRCGSKEPSSTNTTSQNSLTDTIHINPDGDATKDWDMDIELIKLELTPNSLLNEFELYKYYNGRYYVRSKQENSIVCFDSIGQYLYRIHRPGKGKGEYKAIQYLEFDRDQDALFILDIHRNRVIYFDLEQGDFLYEEPYINKLVCIYRIHDWEYIYSGYKLDYVTLYNLHSYNRKNPPATSQRYFPYSRNTDIVRSADPLKYYNNDTLIYNEKYDNTIYHLVDSQFLSRYYINFGHANMPIDFEVENKPGMELVDEIMRKGWAYIATANEMEQYLHILYKYNNESIDAFYDKRTGQLMSFDRLAVNGINLSNCDIVGSTQFSFWGVIGPEQLVMDNPDHPKVRSLDIDENSNPVIFKINIK